MLGDLCDLLGGMESEKERRLQQVFCYRVWGIGPGGALLTYLLFMVCRPYTGGSGINLSLTSRGVYEPGYLTSRFFRYSLLY